MEVKRFLRSEAGATVLWVLASMLLAAVITPWLYQAGMGLAKAAAVKDLPGILEWIGKSSERAKYSRFYSRSLVLAALVLLPFLFRRIRLLWAQSLWMNEQGSRISWKCGLAQTVVGCVVAGSLLWGLGMLLHHWGAYEISPKQPGVGKFVRAVVVPAIAASLIEEWLFRGVLLGLWLRFSKSYAACIGSSFFFAFIHFLEPPTGYRITDPASPLGGFELLGKVILHFTDPRFFVTDFATLFLVGMILAWARLRTGALWFSIGLHVGWILSFKGFNLLYRGVPANWLHPWGVGDSLRSGLLPMATLALTALLCQLALKRFESNKPAC
jgi:membrane protease YdiL (CAAX protease family)